MAAESLASSGVTLVERGGDERVGRILVVDEVTDLKQLFCLD